MCLLLKHWPLITLLMTCKQVTMYFSPTRKPVPSGSPSMCISPTLLLTFVFTSLDITSFCLWVPFEKGWVQANLVVTDFAFWKKKWTYFCQYDCFHVQCLSCIIFQFNFSLPSVWNISVEFIWKLATDYLDYNSYQTSHITEIN